MTTPWTPPGQDLPEPGQPWQAAPPPPHQPLPPAFQQPPPLTRRPAYPGGPHPDGIPPSKAMAGWALGLAFVGCLVVSLVVSVVLAIIVLVESQRDAQAGAVAWRSAPSWSTDCGWW